MKHIVVDIEMNNVARQYKKRGGCNMETIEIGAVMLNERMEELTSFCTFVRPRYNDSIERDITNLTGITYKMVAKAPSFAEALCKFTEWCAKCDGEYTIYAWSNTDYDQLTKELSYKECSLSEPGENVFRTQWTDLQNMFDSKLGLNHSTSLQRALAIAGLTPDGKLHEALSDARNTARLYAVLCDQEKFENAVAYVRGTINPKQESFTLGDLIDFSKFAIAE